MAGFAEILRTLRNIEETDRDVLSGLAAKYPDLDTIVARKKDLDEATLKLTEIQERFSSSDSTLTAWEKWKADNWDKDAGMTKQEKVARDAATRLAAEIETMKAGGFVGGGDMSFADIQEDLKKYLADGKFATADGLKPLTDKLGDVEKLVSNQGAYWEHFYARTNHLNLKYYREFGEKLGQDFDMEAFMGFVAASPERMKDINAAYTEFVKPSVAALDFKVQSETLAKERAEFDAKVAAAATAQAAGGGAGAPTDGTAGAAPTRGHLENRLHIVPKEGEQVDTTPLGAGILAARAAEEYRTKGTLIAQAS